jgi:hypothetical protein
MTVTVLGGVLVTGSNVKDLDTVPDRTVTMYELAGGMNAIRGGNGVSVFLPDWAMNADDFISLMWTTFRRIGRRSMWRAHVSCHVNPKPVDFGSTLCSFDQNPS